jgi:hypothetical protein
MPGFLYQTIDARERARQRRDRKKERVLETEWSWRGEVVSAIK